MATGGGTSADAPVDLQADVAVRTGGVASGGQPASGGSVIDGGAGDQGILWPSRFIGNTTTRDVVRSDFASLWEQITPENVGQWPWVQTSATAFDWSRLDAVYKYAEDNHLVFHEKSFFWGQAQPNWATPSAIGTLGPAWVKAFCERYPNTAIIDVVDEPPPHSTPPYASGMGGSGASGYDWIVQAFKWARQYSPRAVLVLNDYYSIEYATENAHFIEMVTKLRAAGAPLDALGVMASIAYKTDSAVVKGLLDGLADTGLPIYITEYEVDLADDAKQLGIMQEQIPMFWGHPAVKGVTLWGLSPGSHTGSECWIATFGRKLAPSALVVAGVPQDRSLVVRADLHRSPGEASVAIGRCPHCR